MGRTEVTRRQLLAAVAGAGGLGTLVGTGTASVYSDEALFGGSSLGSGRLDLAVSWETAGSSGEARGTAPVEVALSPDEPRQTVDFTLSMPEDGPNNPAAAWLRATCPVDEKLDTDLHTTVRYGNCPADCVVYAGPVTELAHGIPLDRNGDVSVSPGEQRCLTVGDELAVRLDVSATTIESDGTATFELEFAGVQCRNNTPGNPFPDEAACTSSGSEKQTRQVKSIAFCTSETDPIRPSLVAAEPGNYPEVAIWRTAVDVDYVTVWGETHRSIYDYRHQRKRDGIAWPGDPDAAVTVRHPKHQVSSPCQLASSELEHEHTASLQSITVEYDNERWQVS